MPIIPVIIISTVTSIATYLVGFKAGRKSAFDDVEMMTSAMIGGFEIGSKHPVKKDEEP